MLPKIPVQCDWFDQLPIVNAYQGYMFILKVLKRAEKIANFGCWDGVEAFVLLWLLDASEITVLDVEEKHVADLRQLIGWLQNTKPASLQGRSIKPIVADMTFTVAEMPANHFDLAFCHNTLYNLKDDDSNNDNNVQSGVNEMARVIRPGGYLIASEPKMGVKFGSVEGSIAEGPKRSGNPIDISNLFVKAGLKKVDTDVVIPPFTYIYQKS